MEGRGLSARMGDWPIAWQSTRSGLGRRFAEARGLPEEEAEKVEGRLQCLGRAWPGEEGTVEREE